MTHPQEVRRIIEAEKLSERLLMEHKHDYKLALWEACLIAAAWRVDGPHEAEESKP